MFSTKQIKIEDFGKVVTGKTPPTARAELFGVDYPFITPSDIDGVQRKTETARFLSEDGRGYQRSLLLPKNAVCVVCIGATIGKMCLTSTPSFTNQQINSVIVDEEKHNPLYCFYALKQISGNLLSLAGGAATPILNKTSFSNISLEVPEKSFQDKIAFVLSAYDDLIENNTRRIAILEEMARRIYEEWFVRFRFLGHEQVKMVESELGLIPEGWEVKSVKQIIEFDPRVTVPREGEKPFVPMACLSENSMLITNIEKREGNSGSKFMNGDTLFARITPCLENGKTGFVDFLPNNSAAFGSTEFIVLRSKTVTPEFVYLIARSDKFRKHAIKSMSGATGRQRVRVDAFDEYKITQPDKDTLKKFTEVLAPIFKQIRALANKNANLRKTRDLLLPKLISGEVDVSHFPEPENV